MLVENFVIEVTLIEYSMVVIVPIDDPIDKEDVVDDSIKSDWTIDVAINGDLADVESTLKIQSENPFQLTHQFTQIFQRPW